jgi:transposase
MEGGRMDTVDLYLRVRLACHVDGLNQRKAASRFGIARETVRKMLRHSEPPGYRRRQPPKRPKLDPFRNIIDRILEEDRTVHRKQRHTAKRIFERLCEVRRRTRPMGVFQDRTSMDRILFAVFTHENSTQGVPTLFSLTQNI